MRSFPWPSDDGWPYPDSDGVVADGVEDLAAAVDDDIVSLHVMSTHVFDGLDPLERRVVIGRYGLEGAPPRSMKELHHELGVPRADLRIALGSGLEKLRTHLR
jgi:DNA-directed RNA polymerase sigma subunit (sigma70/sigma32)